VLVGWEIKDTFCGMPGFQDQEALDAEKLHKRIDELIAISDKTKTWIVFDDEQEERAIPLDK
jgi:hypothetical protein